MSILEDAIAKFGGEDEAYKLKLKQHIRDGMGYSNYMSRLNNEASGVAGIGDIKGLSPAGIKERISSRFGQQDQNIGSLQQMTGAIDSTAGSLAAAQLDREKSAASAEGMQNGIAFQPKDELDEKLLSAMQDPYNYNPDGTRGDKKSLQQVEAEMNDYFTARQDKNMISYDSQGNMVQRQEIAPEQIKQRIGERTPQDYIGNEGKYMLMAKGYSEKTAKEASVVGDYPTASEPVKAILKLQYPTLIEEFEQSAELGSLLTDATAIGEDGKPRLTYAELQSKYSALPKEQVDKYAKPAFENYAKAEIGAFMGRENKKGVAKIDVFKNIYQGGLEDKLGFDAVKATPQYAEIKSYLETRYGDALTVGELDRMINLYILNSVNE
jgi:hypothetical protein